MKRTYSHRTTHSARDVASALWVPSGRAPSLLDSSQTQHPHNLHLYLKTGKVEGDSGGKDFANGNNMGQRSGGGREKTVKRCYR